MKDVIAEVVKEMREYAPIPETAGKWPYTMVRGWAARLSSTPARALSDSEREALERCEHTAWRPQDIYTLATLVRRLAAGGCVECKHKWRDSTEADAMLPSTWIQECKLCGEKLR